MTDKAGECTRNVQKPLVKVEEQKRKAVFRNPGRRQYRISQIDGCLIKRGIRADYLVSEVGAASVVIELKGTDVRHACDQVLESVQDGAVKKLLEKRIGFLIVCSRYPRFDTFVAKAKQRCAKQFGAGFHVVTNRGEFDIRRVVEIDGPY